MGSGPTSRWVVMALTLEGYTELRVIGRGSSGTVSVFRHDATGTLVAVKRLSPELSADAGFRGRRC